MSLLTPSFRIVNLRKPADYAKAVRTQDELIKVAIANEKNKADARQSIKLGTPATLTQQQQATTDELEADKGKQETEAIKNLSSLGFRYDIVGTIVAKLTPDDLTILNLAFPAIEREFKATFKVERTPPSAFIEFFNKYRDLFLQSHGVSSASSTLFNNKFDSIINNMDDLKSIIPTKDQIEELLSMKRGLKISQEAIERLEALMKLLPTENYFRKLSKAERTEQYKKLAELQDAINKLPTREEFENIISDIKSGYLTPEKASKDIDDLVSPVDNRMLDGLTEAIKVEAVGEPSSNKRQPLDMTDDELDKEKRAVIIGIILQYYRELKDMGYVKTKTELLNAKKPNLIEFYKELRDNIAQPIQTAVPIIPVEQEAGISYSEPVKKGLGTKIGKGIALVKKPTYRRLGKYIIHEPQLDNNILNVKYQSTGRIPSLTPTAVSDGMKDFIFDLLETGRSNQRVFDILPIDERKLFEKVAVGAGVFKELGLKKTRTQEDQKDLERFDLLRGEYLAGNNSQSLQKELRRLIVKFMNDGKIHRTEGVNLLMDLSI